MRGIRETFVDKRGRLHRDDGPAVIWEDGSLEWYQNGFRHREDGGPALITRNGSMAWCEHSSYHRLDGPAIMNADGTRYWYVRGNHIISNHEYQRLSRLTDEEMLLLILKYGEVE